MLFARRGGPGARAAIFGATAGILYGLSATLMKPVVEEWHANGLGDVLADWQLWVMAVAGLVGFYLQQVSLATGRLVASVATVSVANPVVSVLLGALVLQERLDKTPPWHAVVAVGALGVALLGAIVIASVSEQEPAADAAPAQPALA
jgi:EamA domain-containing membrane protein RarD